ncbi:MAG: hypothetical protein JWO04_2895 [Gammaproteobacteria bacterium]|nr:hypothetical protein [Gammaproteobacteria bacterium]
MRALPEPPDTNLPSIEEIAAELSRYLESEATQVDDSELPPMFNRIR